MKVLITSGGTKVPLDPVRDITNKSRGTFGTKIAREFLDRQHEVVFFCAKESRTPFRRVFDFHEPSDWAGSLDEFCAHFNWCERNRPRYQQFDYVNFEDYERGLQNLIAWANPDVIVLAAAVSDYLPTDVAKSKIRTGDDLAIRLKAATKLISLVKDWAPEAFLVGFKLLVGAPDEELLAEAEKSILHNKCNLVVANDYEKLKNGNHEILLVEQIADGFSHDKHVSDAADALVDRILERASKCETSSSASPAV